MRIRSYLILILAIIHLNCHAQFKQFSDQIYFKQFNTEHGLSQASVNCIIRDSKGFMWFGTDDGLNRFDGSQFKIFRNRLADSTSIIDNTVQSLLEDEDGNIWAGTFEGVSRFNRHSEKFNVYRIDGLKHSSCSDLKLDTKNGRLWIAAGVQGVYYFDFQSQTLSSYTHAKLKNVNVLKLQPMAGKLYVGTFAHGVFSIDLTTGQTEDFSISQSTTKTPLNFPVRCLLAEENTLWVGTEGDGVKTIDTRTNEVQSYSKKNNQISDDRVWALATSHDGRVWIGTDGGGLTILNVRTGSSSFHKHSDYNSHTISSNTVRSIWVDASTDAWFGTFNAGVNYHSNLYLSFYAFRKDPENSNSLSHNNVLSFCETEDGTLYIGTDGGGLNYLKNGIFHRYKFPSYVDEPSVILSIHKTHKNDIVLGTFHQGLYFITHEGKIYQYKNNPGNKTTISSNTIWGITEDSKGNIWMATALGINRLDVLKGEFSHYNNLFPTDNPEIFTNEFIQAIMIDSTQTLWGGLYGYLMSYNINTGTVKKYISSGGVESEGLPNKKIISIRQDTRDNDVIWFTCRGGGLIKFDSRAEQITTLTEHDGLPSNLIFAIACDKRGCLWLTTSKGLVRYDPVKHSFYEFDANFGVDTAPFSDNASFVTKEGYILFGGVNGFTAFLPSEIVLQRRGLKVIFTGLKLFNQEVSIDSVILKKSITETTNIEIPYDNARFITLEFSAFQFQAPSSVQYEYMLEGFEDSWHIVDNKRVEFTNLLPGNYTLHVKAGYSSGVWGEENIMEIRIIPVWWMTLFAKIGALVLFVGIVYGTFRFRTYTLKKRKAELERTVAEQNKEIHSKNTELATQNEELIQHNEELLAHRETISLQNHMLNEAQQQLQEINQSLEGLVHQRTEKLNETITQLNKTIKELDAFLYSASHDLVAPLKSILGLVNLAKFESENAELTIYFDQIELSVRKLESVIHTLMQHSFNTKGMSQLQQADVKILAQEAINELRFLPEMAKIKFTLEMEHAIVFTDIPRLKIILSNLIGNAVKYHDPEKKINKVSIHFQLSSNSWAIAISDNGIGIDKDRLSRVFDMFYRATESAKGSGLGLYIVKETVERLNGTIQVESELYSGTQFTVTLPLVSVPNEPVS
jgi:signal transduction histidine kinase/ligand-binding sensor domain-containing protein